MQRLVMTGLLLAGLTAAGLSAFLWWRSHLSTDPATVALPAAQRRSESQIYLRGEGAQVLTLHDALRLLPGTADAQECGTWIDGVDSVGSPSDITQRAAAIPDRVLGDLALTEFRTLTRYLAACGSQEGFDTALAEVEFARTVLERRLVQDGIR